MKPLKETKVFEWFKKNAPNLIEVVGDFVPAPIKGGLNIIKNLIDKEPNLTPEQKEEFSKLALDHELEMEKLALQEKEAYLKDVQSSRDANVKIQESNNASWMSKNVAYILDLFFSVSFALVFILIFKNQVPDGNKEIFYMLTGLLGGYVGQILSFHRGSSKGSKDGAVRMDRMMDRALNK